jgi:hypothetical protein
VHVVDAALVDRDATERPELARELPAADRLAPHTEELALLRR